MDDITSAELLAPTPENYEGRLSQDQQHRFEKTLNRQYMNVLLSPLLVFLYLAIWQSIRLWRGHIDSAWLLLVSLNIVPLFFTFLLYLWFEHRYRPRVPRVSRVHRELGQGSVMQGEGELVWRDHAYTPMLSERSLFALESTTRYLLPGQYRFFYLPETRLLVAAEPLGEPIPHRDLLITLAHAQGFSAATLAANRAGEARKERVEAQDYDTAMIVLLACYGGLFLIMLGALLVAGSAPQISMENGSGSLVLALITLVVAIPALVALPALGGRHYPRLSLSALMEKPRVLAVEGMASKSVRDADYLPVHTIEVGGRQFAIQKGAYFALDTSLPYRVYFLSRDNRLLSLEPLAREAAQAQNVLQ